jgi:hypothetical protein
MKRIHNISKNELISCSDESGKIKIGEVMRRFNCSRWVARYRCNENDLKIIEGNLQKNILTKQCPICSWSGNFQFKRHIIDARDERHQQWIRRLIEIYKQGISYYRMAELKEFKNYNLSWPTIRDILVELKILRQLEKHINACPVCNWTGQQYFLKHLIESNDSVHKQLKESIIIKYRNEKKNPFMIGDELKIPGNLIKDFLKKIGKLRSHLDAVKVSMQTNRHNVNAYGIAGRRKDLANEHYRSVPEANYARILQFEHKSFEHEKCFLVIFPDGKKHNYFLDFLIDQSQAVEIKCFKAENDDYTNKEKIELFKIQYPQYNLKVIFCNTPEWNQLQTKYSKLIPLWETASQNLKTHPHLYKS